MRRKALVMHGSSPANPGAFCDIELAILQAAAPWVGLASSLIGPVVLTRLS